MGSIAPDVLSVLAAFSPAFTSATFARAQLLAVACILCTGRRTISNLPRTVGAVTHGDPSSYHRVLSCAEWSGLQLAALLCRLVLHFFWPSGVVTLVGDDTVTEHPGDKVHGKACHRDAVRSSHNYTAFRWGHKWVVLCVLVRLPFTSRAWALPVLVALYRSPADNKARGRPHKTPAQLMQLLLRIVLRWLPDRTFSFAGDTGFGSHEMALFAGKTKGRLVLISKFTANANLYEPAPPYSGKGRPRVKGAKRPTPAEVVATAARTKLNVAWYGGGRRDVEVVTGTGHWYKAGQGLVEVLWVYVHDLTGTHRDDYLYSTDVTLTAQEVIERYTQRWDIETTFAEMRSYLGLETTRGWCARTVLRAEPILFGLYSVVTLMFTLLPESAQEQAVEWEGKRNVTFSDAITAVRRWLWQHWVFPRLSHDDALNKLPESIRQALLYALAPAA